MTRVVSPTTTYGNRARRTAWAMVIALNALIASPASAGRPLTTEDTGTLDPGKAELELSLDYVRDGAAQLFLLSGGPGLNIGLLPRLEGTVATAIVLLEGDGSLRAGVGDSLVRLKYRFFDETSWSPALMAAVTARLPTGDEDRGLGEKDVDVQPLAVASKALGPVMLAVNAGYTFVTRGRELHVVNLNASAEAGITSAWWIVGEVVSELATSRRADDRLILRAGTVYALGARFKFDAAAGFGVTHASPDLLLTIGVTITLN